MKHPIYDVVVVGGGPAGATAAYELASGGVNVLLLDKAGRIKPCGGAVPPQLLRDFDVPEHVLEAKVSSARMVSPTLREVDMPIETGFVGMVDRSTFDEWLRARAEQAGATRINGSFSELGGSSGGYIELAYRPGKKQSLSRSAEPPSLTTVRTRYVIGADGANSAVAKQALGDAAKLKSVFAYHEIIETPKTLANDAKVRCDVIYDGSLSPDFYSWVFPHGNTISVGTGTAVQGYGIRGSITELRRRTGLDSARTIRKEGAPIPLKPLKRWDDGKHVLLAGDAAGVVAPASGEGIFYAMTCGRIAAKVMQEVLRTDNVKTLKQARKQFLRAHGKVFMVLGAMQYFWYSSDKRRERFVTMCDDADVQRLTWESYLNKRLVKRDYFSHVKIFFKDLAHLLGITAVNGRR